MLYLKDNKVFLNDEVTLMFSYIHLENFKSFENITFDFHQNKHEAKKMIAIYGENGSGKSNFVSAFEVLWMFFKCLPHSKPNTDFLKLLAFANESGDISLEPAVIDAMLDRHSCQTNIFSFLRNCRMAGCEKTTVIEFGFIIDAVEGHYTLKFTDQILFEELYYLHNQRRAKLFTISQSDSGIQSEISKVTKNKSYQKELKELVHQYWGKYSFWSILADELIQKNAAYLIKNLSNSVATVFLTLMSTSSSYQPSAPKEAIMNNSYQIAFPAVLDIVFGETSAENEKYLKRYEELLTSYLSQLYPDVVEAYYKNDYRNDRILYQLYIRKKIAGLVRDINFNMESTGTRKLVDELQPLVNVLYGFVSVYDEIDSNIHDLLMRNLLMSLAENIPNGGQLIFTTHNTLLLETIDPNSVYVINIDSEGNKEVSCCSDYDYKRIQRTNNLRNLYLKGMFGGIPYSTGIDFSFADTSDMSETEDVSEE